MKLKESERKVICDYLLERKVDHETIHRVCLIISGIIEGYKEESLKSREEQYRLQRILDSVVSNDYETFSYYKSNG